ncbi:hypothetical protein BJY01DRAFT_27341 [Aspergillus pseudoustus]|uniref:Uncharacterized protein n=1 Tax=Aspergillus pseudoustus TaxID=1810923 RepID=A0ABR4JHX0_9EURO
MASSRNQPDLYSHLESGGSVLTNVHRLGQETLAIVDRLIEPQTIAEFLKFAVEGTLPNGKRTSLQLITPEDISLVQGSPADDNDPRDIEERVMSRIGSLEDGERLCLLGKNIHAIKNRAWAGIIPLSEQRWREKGLDRDENFDLATQYLSAVIAAFEYLNEPRVMKNMRDTFNLISEHWGQFERMIHARRESGHGVRMRKLWTAFMAAHFEVVTERAHRWVIVHINALRQPLAQQLRTHVPVNLDQVDSVQWKITDRLHILTELAGLADYTIVLPMNGYEGYIPPAVETGVPPALRSTNLLERQKAYAMHLKQVCRREQVRITMERVRREGPNRPRRRNADPADLAETTRLQIECQARVRREARGDPIEPMPKEPWITHGLNAIERSDSDNKGRGFVIYRLTYGQPEDEWKAFQKKLEEHVSDWGMGQTGSSKLKPHLKLHWIDGSEFEIEEGDIAAARKHFLEHYDDELPFRNAGYINKRAFLAVDASSYCSYTGTTYAAATDLVIPGDHTGFVVAVDGEYEEKGGPDRPDECPGYQGHMRILGNLVWGDLFAMLSSQSAIIEDIWPLALEHPNQVYVGPTVPLQIRGWRIQNEIRGMLMRTMAEYGKAKVDGRLWPANNNNSESTPSQPTSIPRRHQRPRPARPARPAPSFDPTGVPHLDGNPPIDDAMRTYLGFQFVRWLREEGRHREAILVEETMRVPPGQIPDMDNVHRRMVLEGAIVEGANRNRQRPREEDGDGDAGGDNSNNPSGGSANQ